MSKLRTTGNGIIIQEFLLEPRNRRKFNRFFALCHSDCIVYLRSLRARGYRLPIDQYPLERLLDDLAMDLLGGFLASKDDRPFYRLATYFQELFGEHISEESPDAIYAAFRELLGGFVRQELVRLRGAVEPQILHLERRLKEVLKSGDFGHMFDDATGEHFVFLQEHVSDLRLRKPVISAEALQNIVWDAFFETTSRTAWILRVFALLNEKTTVRNTVSLNQLIQAAVRVNTFSIELESHIPAGLPTPVDSMVEKAAEQAIADSLNVVQNQLLPQFRAKGRLTLEDSMISGLIWERYFKLG